MAWQPCPWQDFMPHVAQVRYAVVHRLLPMSMRLLHIKAAAHCDCQCIAHAEPAIHRQDKIQGGAAEQASKGLLQQRLMRRGEFASTIRTEQYRDLLKA